MIKAGIDIGTNSIRLVMDDEIVFDEPSLVAVDKKGRALAIGYKAQEMQGLADEAVRVLSSFVENKIDFRALDALLEQLCYEYRIFRLFQKTVLLVSHPTVLSEDMIALLKDHLISLGAEKAFFNPEIWMAAVGAKLDLSLPVGSCVMHIGYSNCDIALFTGNRLLERADSEMNGKAVSDILASWLRYRFNLIVSGSALDQIQRELGNIRITGAPRALQIHGLDASTHILNTVVINENEIASILSPLVRELAHWITSFITSLPEKYQEDIRLRGIVACGGTMKLRGLAESLQTMVGCPVYVTDEPTETVCEGLKILLKQIEN